MKIEQIGRLMGTGLRPEDERFIRNLQSFLPPGQVEALSGPQLKYLNGLFDRYCTAINK